MKLVLKKLQQTKTNQTKSPKSKKQKTPKKQQHTKKGAKHGNTHYQNQNFDSISIFISWCKENCFKNVFLRDNPNWKLFYKVREV